MKKYYWKFRIFLLAMKWIFRTNLGDLVWYEGKQYEVCNGTRDNSWRLDLENDNGGWVRRNDCRKVWSWRNCRHSFAFGWNFYMTNWYDIWCQAGIKDWMRGCNIW
ncbi:MAG: hypothetical protein WC343_07950 [Bacilli bacterium]|jgi:hypothetical protein